MNSLIGPESVFWEVRRMGWTSPNESKYHPADGQFPGGINKRTGTPLPNAKNIPFCYELLGVTFCLDERSGYRYAVIPQELARPGLECGRQFLDDPLERQRAHELLERFGLQSPEKANWRAIQTECDKSPFEPVREEFDRIRTIWDGTPRLETWLQAYLYVEDTALFRAFGCVAVLSLVARVYNPGCKADQSLLLAGPQGVGKSSVARIMAMREDWFAEIDLATLDDQRLIEQTPSSIVVELSEADRASKREAGHIKAMLSKQVDSARLAYHRATKRRPRSFIFVLTTNSLSMLSDPTGARRYLPVVIPQPVKLVDLRRDWRQILAEAIHVFETQYGGDPSRVVLPANLHAAARAVREEHRALDPWEETIRGWTAEAQGNEKSMFDLRATATETRYAVKAIRILERLTGIGARTTPADGRRLAAIMQGLGWDKTRSGGQTIYLSPPQ